MSKSKSIQQLSVIVPENPFIEKELQDQRPCLCAMDVEKLMEWWPGTPHAPHRDPKKVKAIQRSLDWKRVAQIASYLLQAEIVDAPDKIRKYFSKIYEPKKSEPGREWPPKVSQVVGFHRSSFRTFSNVLLHINGAKITRTEKLKDKNAAYLIFDEKDKNLNFSVIDGQHRINGAYLAVCIKKEKDPSAIWEIPAQIFLDLDPIGTSAKQAQIFIDVNFYQKKVDRSLVADLFPTARGREALDNNERAQDIGRKLMLEVGPLVEMIQVPGIRFGVSDVITLATLNGSIEDIIEVLDKNDITSLEMQTDFISQCLTAWLESSGRKEKGVTELDPENVVYQGRIIVSILALIPAIIWKLKKANIQFISDNALEKITEWFKDISICSNLLDKNKFIMKSEFKKRGYLGSGGIAKLRNLLWAAIDSDKNLGNYDQEKIEVLAKKNKAKVSRLLP